MPVKTFRQLSEQQRIAKHQMVFRPRVNLDSPAQGPKIDLCDLQSCCKSYVCTTYYVVNQVY